MREWIKSSNCEKVRKYEEYGQTPWGSVHYDILDLSARVLTKINRSESRDLASHPFLSESIPAIMAA